MELKRNFHEDDGSEGWGGPPKRRLAFSDAAWNVLKLVSMNEIAIKMEPLFRRVVREEMEGFLHTIQQSRSANNRIEPSGGRGLELRFESNVPSTIFTGGRVETEQNSPVKVVLFDARTNSIVTSGPMSSAKIEIVVLSSDFASDDQENWTEIDFTSSILCQREGKRPLITGELNVTLRDGVGYITDVSFTDNSSWTRSRKFKLGARVVQRVSGEVRIREAVSEAFMVKDHRGELYKKHHPPQLDSEVWRLERIAKGGASHKRLAKHGINTVMDFLRMYFMDSSKLRRIIEGGISNRVWDIIMEHAKACVVNDNKLYVYYRDQAGVVFNSVYKAVGITFDGQNFMPVDTLSSSQKMFMEDLKRRAYKNHHDIIPMDLTLTGDFGSPLESLPEPEPFSVTDSTLQHLDFPIIQQGTQVGFNDAEASTSYAGDQMEAHVTHNYDSIPANMFCPMMRNTSFRMLGFSPGTHSGWPPSDISEVQTTTWSPAVPWGQGSGLMQSPGLEFLSCHPNVGVHITRRRSRAGWCKIRAAIKWRITAKQGVAAKRMASLWNF